MEKHTFLECERWWNFALLMFVGGFFGTFAFCVRGGMFCNAQTANFVLFAIALGEGDWTEVRYLCIPITAYFLGAVVSEAAGSLVKRLGLIRWDTLFIMLEMGAVVILGLIPDSAPFHPSQVLINFICSMQYNTFRQADGIPMATTFCTNHLRQVGIAFTKAIRHRDPAFLRRFFFHTGMLAVFVAGGFSGAVLSQHFKGRAIFFALIPLAVVLADLLYADLKKEKGEMERIPRGH